MDQFEIRVAGHLSRRRARALGCDDLHLLSSGDSLLRFAAVDQAALYGLLARLRDAGLELLGAERIPARIEAQDRQAAITPKEASDVID